MNPSCSTTSSYTPSEQPAGLEQHRDYLYRNALGRLRNAHQAEDAVQETFLAAIHGAKRFSGASSERSWLTGILKHKVCDQMRRACRDRVVFDGAEITERAEFSESARTTSRISVARDNPVAELERKELRDAIHSALEKLPARLATAFSLYEAEDWSGPEVCQALGISDGNLWIMLHRARKQLRAQLSPWYAAARL